MLCSRHNPSLLQRNGTGSHLYTPNLHTLGLQGTHSVERTYIALVGFGFNRCLSLPYIYIIPHLSGFVKRFLKIFQKTFSRLTAHTYCASLIARPLTLILYHTFMVLSRGFAKIMEKILSVPYCLLGFHFLTYSQKPLSAP